MLEIAEALLWTLLCCWIASKLFRVPFKSTTLEFLGITLGVPAAILVLFAAPHLILFIVGVGLLGWSAISIIEIGVRRALRK